MRRAAFTLILLSVSSFAVEAPSDFAGKTPEASEAVPAPPAPEPSDSLPTPPVPKPFTTLANAVEFIEHQRGALGAGLPATFYVPPSLRIDDPLQRLLIGEGVGLYDTALAVIALVEAGRLGSAQQILGIYAQGEYAGSPGAAPMELRAFPSPGSGGSFEPFDDSVHYYFDFTNVHGDWRRWRDGWKFWAAHSGPNAWLAIADARFISAARAEGIKEEDLAPYLEMARRLGRALQRLQDPAAGGGVRFGPEGDWHPEGTSPPYEEINTENNLSAYAAFQALYQVMQDASFRASGQRILNWLQQGPVYSADGRPLKGLWDPETSTLGMGAEWKGKRWVRQTPHPTDAGGTIALDALGPETIDRLWGAGSAFRMWRTIRARAGRTAQFRRTGPQDALAGLDFSDGYPENESLITPEWSAQGLFALAALRTYYRQGAGRGQVAEADLNQLDADRRTMTDFLKAHPNAYAWGPGLAGKRQGQTGFGWSCPPQEVQAMPSILLALYLSGREDPAAWGRRSATPLQPAAISASLGL